MSAAAATHQPTKVQQISGIACNESLNLDLKIVIYIFFIEVCDILIIFADYAEG